MRIPFLLLLCVFSMPSFAYELYLVRHFEKQKDHTDPALTKQGVNRAESLVNILKNKDLSVVYSTDFRRTQQTAMPTATAINKPVSVYSPYDLPTFAEQLKSNRQNALIVGHSNTTPVLVSLLGGSAKKIAESEYGELFILIVLDDKVVTQSIRVGS